ncbi:2Fe-2S iron-sulfur cluster-binding protein [Streptomyces sp. HC307]|uniref:2Fe-2S iron-sulfur cluster-binding protein n=1 Tax=Streptomyces flavusporus TaxID=3385496 RepID=UPI00391743AD
MTDDQHEGGTPQGGGRWDPLPQGDYDDGATAFVKLPEGGVDALLAAAESPLAAPGHGYVPPPITVTPATTAGTDPAATGTWAMPSEGVQWPDPNAVPQDASGQDQFTYNPPATGQWTFEDANAAEASAAPGHDVTGQWSIPVANGDLPDESGEFTTSSLVEQWGGTPPATLPGGASAPWATESVGQPWSREPSPGAGTGPSGHEHGEPGPSGDQRHEPEQSGAAAQQPDPGQSHPGQAAPSASAYASAARAEEAAQAARPAQPYAEASPPAPVAGETVEDTPGAHGPEEAAESPAESSAPPAPAGGAGTGPEGAEQPVTGADGKTTDDAPEEADAPAAPSAHEEHPLVSYVLRVNGTERPVTDAWIGESLLYVLRERLGLAGAKDGCSQGECGACNVQVDGRLVASCLVPAVTAAGSEVRTVEGLAADGQPSDVQRALARCGAVQCGFCVPGMAMTVHDLLEGNPAPTELETRQALCGNLCRCSGYRAVLDAVKDVVAEREAHSAADAAEHDADEARIPHQAEPGAGGVNPSAFESPGSPGPHDQPYGQGQDGGQA